MDLLFGSSHSSESEASHSHVIQGATGCFCKFGVLLFVGVLIRRALYYLGDYIEVPLFPNSRLELRVTCFELARSCPVRSPAPASGFSGPRFQAEVHSPRSKVLVSEVDPTKRGEPKFEVHEVGSELT